jgi:hypothetical protein
VRLTRIVVTASFVLVCIFGMQVFATQTSLAQGVPANAVPYISEVTPPGLLLSSPSGTFTLTILGANFTSNDVVNLSGVGGGSPAHPVSTTVNAAGSQITAVFSSSPASPGTFAVSVTNPAGPSTSNAWYLPDTPPQPGVTLNQSTTPFLTGVPKAIVAGPFGSTSFLAFAAISQGSNTVSIETSNISGPFQAGPSYPTGNGPSGIVALDIFNSGQPGFAITNSADNTVSILLPNGGGTYRPGNLITLPGAYPTAIVAGDFNGDGKIDLAVLETCGTIQSSCYPRAVPNGPGMITILFGDATGNFTASPSAPITGLVPYAMVAADFNGDGILDLAVANSGDNTVTLLMGNGDGTFTPANASAPTGNAPNAMAVGDFNGDGNLDLAITNYNDNTISILLNQNCSAGAPTACTFAPAAVSPAVGSGPSAIAAGDLNADGFLDLAVTNSNSNSVTILLGNGAGAFTATVPATGPNYSTGTTPEGLVLADFNADGRLDIVTANAGSSFTYLRQAAVPQLSLTTSNASPTYGLFVNYTATLSPGFAQPVPSSTVTLYDGATPIKTIPMTQYQVVFQYNTLGVGTHQVHSVFNGDSNFTPATSNSVSEYVSQSQTTTTLSSNVTSVPYGLPFTLTANVQQNSGTSVTGLVSFFDETTSTDLGDVTPTNNQAQLTLSKLSAGPHVIIAVYQGDAKFNTSQSSSVTVTSIQTATTTTVAGNPSTASAGQTVTFTATVTPSPSNPVTGTVNFLDAGAVIGTGAVSGNSAHFSTSTLSVGSHPITAQYSGDSNFTGSTSSAIGETITVGATTTALTISPNPATYAQSVTLTGTVTPPTGLSASGTVNFMDGTTSLGTATISNNVAQLSVTTLALGSHSLTAVYSGSATLATSTSSAVVENISQASTTVTNVSSLNPAPFGQAVQFTATVQTPNGSAATGNVTFYDGSTSLGSPAVTNNGTQHNTATLIYAGFLGGTHTITATYGGDTNFTGSTSAPLTETVTPVSSSVSLAASVNPVVFGQLVTFTATVTPSIAGDFAGGSVTFLDGGATLGTVSLSTETVQFTVSNLNGGTHSITARYSGDANFAGSISGAISESVTPAATTTAISSSSNPSTFGQAIVLTASIVPPSGVSATGTVTFMDGSNVLGTASVAGNAAQLAVSALAIGSHSLTATYSGNGNLAASSSGALTQRVNQAATSTSLSASSNPAIYGQSVTLTAAIVPANGGSATGTVTFLNGTATLGTATVSGDVAQLVVAAGVLTLGTHSFTAKYSGDSNFLASTSSALSESVTAASTTTSLATSASPSVVGKSVTFTATVSSTSTGTISGTVKFFVDGSSTASASKSLSGGSAAFSTSSLADGTHTVIATFASSNGNFLGSTSTTLTQAISDFAVAVSPSSITVARSQSGSTAVTVTSIEGFSGDTALSCTGGTAKISCSVSASSVTLDGINPQSATVTITVASNAGSGSHTLTLQGVSGGLTRKATLNLTVN